MDFITDQGWGARANSKARNRLSDKNFIFIDNGQINLLSGKGKKDRNSRTATAQWEFTEATASEINHDLVIVLSVRSLK